MIREKLTKITFEKNIPLYFTFELTYRCNLNCRHCCIVHTYRKKELNTDEVKYILKILKKYGAFQLVFTGGEVLLREDFLTLCKYAKELNYDLTIFTNATLINEKIINSLKNIGITSVDISIYGKKEIHDFITRVKGSYEKTLNAIKLLKKAAMNVTLKSLLMNINFPQYTFMLNLSKRCNVNIKFDIVVTPKFNGSKEPLKYRLSEKQLEYILPKLTKRENVQPSHAYDFTCSAGKNLLSVDPYGNLYACMQIPYRLGNLLKEDFYSLWNSEKMNFIRNIGKKVICYNNCKYTAYCGRCPGLALVESGDLFSPFEFSCKLAKIYKELYEKNL